MELEEKDDDGTSPIDIQVPAGFRAIAQPRNSLPDTNYQDKTTDQLNKLINVKKAQLDPPALGYAFSKIRCATITCKDTA